MKDSIIALLHKHELLKKVDIANLLEKPKDETKGDWALPCFTLAKLFKKNPVGIAQDIVDSLKGIPNIEKFEAVGPYVNFFLDRKRIAEQTIAVILKQKEQYGRGKKTGKKMMIEFSQPNTHKAFHIGHVRGTSFGESLARIREFYGDKVIRANYSGDTGMHIAKWLWCYMKFHKNEKITSEESWFAKIYVEAVQKLEENENGKEEVEEINRKLDAQQDKKLIALWKKTRAQSIAAWKSIYKDLDVNFDKHYFESEVESRGKELAHELVKKNIAVVSEGAKIMDFNDINLGVWVLLRSDGTVLYSAKDLALAEIKWKQYAPDESLVITTVEQNLHFEQLRATLERMKFPRWEHYGHLGYESVRLPEGKMSSRTGSNVLYTDFKEELIAEAHHEIAQRAELTETESNNRALSIAIAALKYTMLKQDIHKVIVFDKEEALRFEGDTGPYLLYSYARAQSILRKARYKPTRSVKVTKVEEKERALVSTLDEFPSVIEQAARKLDPSEVAHYAYRLAQTFNEFYHEEKVIGSENEIFKLALVQAFSLVLRQALYVLGIPVLEEM